MTGPDTNLVFWYRQSPAPMLPLGRGGKFTTFSEALNVLFGGFLANLFGGLLG